MEIERINSYDDKRFSKEVLFEHGAFIIDKSRTCSFKITGERSAQVLCDSYEDIRQVIEQFRFFTEHITTFYDTDGNIIAEYPPVAMREMTINDVQPSQFFVDSDKLKAISSFIKNPKDIIIPVLYDKRFGRYISLDGHTRLFFACKKGWEKVRVFESESDDHIYHFVDEARKMGIFSPKDMTLLPHSEYVEKWDGYCDDFFAGQEQQH